MLKTMSNNELMQVNGGLAGAIAAAVAVISAAGAAGYFLGYKISKTKNDNEYAKDKAAQNGN